MLVREKKRSRKIKEDSQKTIFVRTCEIDAVFDIKFREKGVLRVQQAEEEKDYAASFDGSQLRPNTRNICVKRHE